MDPAGCEWSVCEGVVRAYQQRALCDRDQLSDDEVRTTGGVDSGVEIWVETRFNSRVASRIKSGVKSGVESRISDWSLWWTESDIS